MRDETNHGRLLLSMTEKKSMVCWHFGWRGYTILMSFVVRNGASNGIIPELEKVKIEKLRESDRLPLLYAQSFHKEEIVPPFFSSDSTDETNHNRLVAINRLD